VTVGRDGDDILLTWNEENVNREYVVYRVTDYIQLTGLYSITVYDGNYTDYGAIGDPYNNYVYTVRGENSCGGRSWRSNKVAEYDFLLAAEEAANILVSKGKLRLLHFAVISLPLEGDDLPTTADGVADYIDPEGSVKGVAKWNPQTRSWIVRRVGSPYGTPDFAVAPGDVLLLGMTEHVPDTFAWVGDIPAEGSIQNDLTPGVANALIVPLDQSGEFTSDADGLANAVGDVTHVGVWSTAQQRWYIRVVGQSGPNFTIYPGQPYGIRASQSTPQVWPE
jgi:hypothetical protein